MAIETVLVPEERKSALIGKKGRTKATIERCTNTKLRISSFVEIEGEAIDVMVTRNIVTAIARGFHPKDAMILSDEEYGMEIVSLRGETEKAEKRLLARVIGKSGSSKKIIEDETGAKISIYGKTVSIIGTVEELKRAQEAVELLLKGKTHAYVFGRLKKGLIY